MTRFDRWIFEEYRTSHQSLAIYRILYASAMLIMFMPRGLWLNKAPDAFYNPPISLPAFFTALPPDAFIVSLNVLATLSLMMLLIGWHTLFASLATALLLLLITSWECSLGKINHDVLMVLVPFVLAFSGWGKTFSLDAGESASELDQDPDNLRGSWAVTMMALLIGLTMFTAGWQKLRSGWAAPSLFATQGHLTINYYVRGSETWAGEMLLASDSLLLWKSADWGVLAMECGFLIAAFRRKLFVVFCAVACIFHLGVVLIFDIQFVFNVVAYAVVVNWSLLPFGEMHRLRRMRVFSLALGAIAIATFGTVMLVGGARLEPPPYVLPRLIVLGAGALIGVIYLITLAAKSTSRK